MFTTANFLELFGEGSGIRKLFEGIPQGAINMGIGNVSSIPVPDEILNAGKEDLSRKKRNYLGNRGHPDLLGIISQKREISPEDILITQGGTQAINLALWGHINPGDEVLIPSPGFPMYEKQVIAHHGKPVFYNLDPDNGYSIDAEGLSSLITDRTVGIVLNTVSNPTGTVLDESVLKRVASICEEKNLWIISDEVYDTILSPDALAVSMRSIVPDRTMRIDSFSKKFLIPDLRLGYVEADKETIDRLVLLAQCDPVHAVSASQAIGIRALEYGFDVSPQVHALREHTIGLLNQYNIPYITPQGAIYVYLDGSQLGKKSGEIANEVLSNGVVLVPGTAFNDNRPMLRMCYTSVKRENIEEAIKKIAPVFNLNN